MMQLSAVCGDTKLSSSYSFRQISGQNSFAINVQVNLISTEFVSLKKLPVILLLKVRKRLVHTP